MKASDATISRRGKIAQKGSGKGHTARGTWQKLTPVRPSLHGLCAHVRPKWKRLARHRGQVTRKAGPPQSCHNHHRDCSRAHARGGWSAEEQAPRYLKRTGVFSGTPALRPVEVQESCSLLQHSLRYREIHRRHTKYHTALQ